MGNKQTDIFIGYNKFGELVYVDYCPDKGFDS